jgi:hypothetical protein
MSTSELFSDHDGVVGVEREDDGVVIVTFGPVPSVTAGRLAAAFASLPEDAEVYDILVSWYNIEDDGCEGQEFEDDLHDSPVLSVLLTPAPPDMS